MIRYAINLFKFLTDLLEGSRPYTKKNCKWSTVKEQNNNRRDNRILTYRGKTQTAAQWSDELGIIRSTLYERIRRGSPIEVILKEAV